MVSRYHWLQFGADIGWPAGPSATISNDTLTIPAGGILKKIIWNTNIVQGIQSGSQNTSIGMFGVSRSVSITSGPNNGRVIFNADYAIPLAVTSIISGLQNQFTAWHNGGNKELWDELECSYGKAADPANWTIRIIQSLVNYYGTYSTSVQTGRVALTGKALYYK